MIRRLWMAAVVLAVAATPLAAQRRITLDSTLLAAFRWRPVGPANMAGRITDVEGIPGSATFFFAAASGGIWKTTNGGTTFRPVFDNYACISMGDLAIAPSDTMQVWAGTGEEDSRNSISPGCGIYKSTDGGLTWKASGLEKTGAIGRIGQAGGGGGGGFGGLNQIANTIRGTPAGGGGGGGGGFGGGGAPAVTTGDYLVSITVDGKKLTRVLRVERGR